MNNIIKEKLLQKPPFQMVDDIIEYDKGKSITAVKLVSANEYYLQGHFPDFPIMPGVLLVEAAAQASSLVLSDFPENTIPVLVGIENMKLSKPVFPGSIVIIKSVLSDRSGAGLYIFNVILTTNNTVCARGKLTFTFMDKAKAIET